MSNIIVGTISAKVLFRGADLNPRKIIGAPITKDGVAIGSIVGADDEMVECVLWGDGILYENGEARFSGDVFLEVPNECVREDS